tara:strand:- start:471 stop:1187 length:717 start_codon:yes stop_codon:yes gene_type:complete
MKRLGVNIDHIATVRNARGENHPDLYKAAKYALTCGANLITIHLREDRRHVKDADLKKLSSNKKILLNLELAADYKMLKIALKNKPNFACIVPEKRKEVTTEGGLNLKRNYKKIKLIVNKLKINKIRTSLFINPNIKDVKISHKIKVDCIELHTGKISKLVKSNKNYLIELNKIKKCANFADQLGLEVHAGHGMDYKTTRILSKINEIKEFNIGHFIIGESIFFGLKKTISKLIKICK